MKPIIPPPAGTPLETAYVVVEFLGLLITVGTGAVRLWREIKDASRDN